MDVLKYLKVGFGGVCLLNELDCKRGDILVLRGYTRSPTFVCLLEGSMLKEEHFSDVCKDIILV